MCIWYEYKHFVIIKYQMWLQIMEHHLILLGFFWEFSDLIDDYSCLNCCISTKHSLIVCVINTNMSKCQMRLQAMECLLILSRFFCFFCIKITNIHVWSAFSSPNIHKLCFWYEYKHCVIMRCQMWLQIIECLLILLHFFRIIRHNWRPFMSELLYFHQTFKDFISNQ